MSKIKKFICWIEMSQKIEAKNEDEALQIFKDNFDLINVDFRVVEDEEEDE